MKFYLEMLSTY